MKKKQYVKQRRKLRIIVDEAKFMPEDSCSFGVYLPPIREIDEYLNRPWYVKLRHWLFHIPEPDYSALEQQ